MQAISVQPSLSLDSQRLCTPKCTGPGGRVRESGSSTRVVFKQGPAGSVWVLERSVKDMLNNGQCPEKPVGTDPRTPRLATQRDAS